MVRLFSLLFGPLKPFLVKARRDCAQAGRKALQPCWIAIGFVLEICPSGARKRHFHSRIIVWTPAGESSKAIPTHPGWTVAFRSAAPSEEESRASGAVTPATPPFAGLPRLPRSPSVEPAASHRAGRHDDCRIPIVRSYALCAVFTTTTLSSWAAGSLTPGSWDGGWRLRWSRRSAISSRTNS